MRPGIAIAFCLALAAFAFGLLAAELVFVAQGPREINVRIVAPADGGFARYR